MDYQVVLFLCLLSISAGLGSCIASLILYPDSRRNEVSQIKAMFCVGVGMILCGSFLSYHINNLASGVSHNPLFETPVFIDDGIAKIKYMTDEDTIKFVNINKVLNRNFSNGDMINVMYRENTGIDALGLIRVGSDVKFEVVE